MPREAPQATLVHSVDSPTGRLELTLDPDPGSPRVARRAVVTLLRRLDAGDELVHTAALLVSEVVTNAVVHAGTAVQLGCEAGRFGVRVEVADESPLPPIVGEQTDDASTGRGLVLVDALAREHGVRLAPAGKVVWFVLGDLG